MAYIAVRIEGLDRLFNRLFVRRPSDCLERGRKLRFVEAAAVVGIESARECAVGMQQSEWLVTSACASARVGSIPLEDCLELGPHELLELLSEILRLAP